MSVLLKTLSCVVLPLAWGLAVEFAFERLRRYRARRKARRAGGSAR